MKELFSQVVAVADVPNKNKRIYPKAVLENIVSQFEAMKNEKNELLGQLGMPGDSIVHFSEVSHIVSELRMDGDKLVADICVMNSPSGKLLENLINDGVAMAYRLQGVGGADHDGDNWVIQDSYKMIAINALPKKEAA